MTVTRPLLIRLPAGFHLFVATIIWNVPNFVNGKIGNGNDNIRKLRTIAPFTAYSAKWARTLDSKKGSYFIWNDLNYKPSNTAAATERPATEEATGRLRETKI
ncbi:hypothetical protein [Rhizobium sp. BR 362]|uniref:hypothetical protein n=1 Tax=Rhizobium sp. BR 362 TaxID=3040670 RepID=UPI002F3E6369